MFFSYVYWFQGCKQIHKWNQELISLMLWSLGQTKGPRLLYDQILFLQINYVPISFMYFMFRLALETNMVDISCNPLYLLNISTLHSVNMLVLDSKHHSRTAIIVRGSFFFIQKLHLPRMSVSQIRVTPVSHVIFSVRGQGHGDLMLGLLHFIFKEHLKGICSKAQQHHYGFVVKGHERRTTTMQQ